MIKFEQSFINGEWITGEGKSKIKVLDKYDQSTLSEIPSVSDSQVDGAIEGAAIAYSTLRGFSAEKRRNLLETLRGKVSENREDLITLIIKEAGKPRSYAIGELDRALKVLELAAEEATRIQGDVIPMDFMNGKGKTAYTIHVPSGPVAAISPFNFPLNLAMHKIAPALAVGTSVILKPSPYTPLTALFIAKLVSESGYPDGTLNVLVAENEQAQRIIEDDRPTVFSFTGSPTVGWSLKSKAGKKKVILELGGNAATIIDRTANDLKDIAKTVAYGTFLYSGQICISTQRILVHQDIKEAFIHHLVEATKELGLGDPDSEDNLIGPIISREHLKRIASWVEEAKKDGAEIILGGEVIDEKHNLYSPTLLSNVKKGMRVVDEEVFGPVGVIQSYSDIDEAIEMTNDSRYGLQAGIYTDSIEIMKKASKEIEVGGLMINNIPGFRVDNMPYGGVKDSGLGREGVTYTMRELTEERIIVF